MKDLITVTTAPSYTVHLETGALPQLGSLIKPLSKAKTVVVVSDNHVMPLYGATVVQSLTEAGFTVRTFTVPHGEVAKTPKWLIELIEYLAQACLTRKDMLVALGGGVVGDLTGFAAATYLRGIDYVQVPTTLLSAVDSSVGGKTAVNLAEGKNLWGAFKQPLFVLCDPLTLQTLPETEWHSGCGEVIKYGMIGHPDLLDDLRQKPMTFNVLQQDPSYVRSIIARCIRAKADVVAHDEKEQGLRKLLNFGHTFGHGIEAFTDFTIPHGIAVAIGTALLIRASVKNGDLPAADGQTFLDLLIAHGLPIETDATDEALLEAALHDKKSEGASVTLIYPVSYGHCELRPVAHKELGNYIVR